MRKQFKKINNSFQIVETRTNSCATLFMAVVTLLSWFYCPICTEPVNTTPHKYDILQLLSL